MKKAKSCFKEFMEDNWSVAEKILACLVTMLSGIILGFILAPPSKGLHIRWSFGCNNGSNNGRRIGNAKDKKAKNKKGKKSKSSRCD